jgi:spore maturation protein CgeB
VTRADMIRLGYSPSVRLFEAAACGVPIISDRWPGLATIFTPGREILVADSAAEVLGYLRDMPEAERLALADRARRHVLANHTAAHRAALLESYVEEVAAPAFARRLVMASNRSAAPAFRGSDAPDVPPR